MKPRLLDHLVCPLDRTPLELRTWDSTPRTLNSAEAARADRLGIAPAALETEVLTGVLVNRARQLVYPIVRGVPRMLAFRTGIAEQFAAEHAARLREELPGYELPRETSMPGEEDVLRTFSSEWLNYDWDGQAYWNLTPEAWFRCMRFALELDANPVRDQLVLEVGIGIGGVAHAMAAEEQAEVVGVDLGYAVDAAQRHFGMQPFLHIVQASAFAPPFRAATFDFVYSFGVIHHTFSTRTAFRSLQDLARPGGRMYIWVYSPFHEQRTPTRRVLMAMESAIRPWLWRLPEGAQAVVLAPIVPLYMGYQLARTWQEGPGYVRYGLREAFHAARDRFTPRYIHRHTEQEVAEWFREAGYDQLSFGSQRERPDWVPIAFTACTGVAGRRAAGAASGDGAPTA